MSTSSPQQQQLTKFPPSLGEQAQCYVPFTLPEGEEWSSLWLIFHVLNHLSASHAVIFSVTFHLPQNVFEDPFYNKLK